MIDDSLIYGKVFGNFLLYCHFCTFEVSFEVLGFFSLAIVCVVIIYYHWFSSRMNVWEIPGMLVTYWRPFNYLVW